jgi:hypothetical protein
MTIRRLVSCLASPLLAVPFLPAQATVGPWTVALTAGNSFGNVVACASNAPGVQTDACVLLEAISNVTGPPGVTGSACNRVVEGTTTLTVGPGARMVRFSYALAGVLDDDAVGEMCNVSAWVKLDGGTILSHSPLPPGQLTPCLPGNCPPSLPVSSSSFVELCLAPGPYTVVAGLGTYVVDNFCRLGQSTIADFMTGPNGLTVCVTDRGPCSGGLLHDNGPIITHPGAGSGGADVSALDNTATFHTPHNIFGFGAQAPPLANNALADDFTVCGTWTVTHLELFGYATGVAPPSATLVYAQIWNGDPRAGGSVIWGDLTTNLVTSAPTGVFNCYRTLIGTLGVSNRAVQAIRVQLPSPLTLPPGVYWLEFQFSGVSFCPPVTENEMNDTGNAIQRVGQTWALLNNAIAPNTAGVAVPFRIHGTAMGQTLASATTYGAGKLGSNGVGAWDLATPVRNPVLGRDHVLRLVNGFPGSSPVVLIGNPQVSGIAFPPFGIVYVLPIITSFFLPPFGAASSTSMRLPIPHGANLCGLVLGLQGFWGDPGAAGLLAHSNGLQLRLGN